MTKKTRCQERFKEMYLVGLTLYQIGQIFGLSSEQIKRCLKKQGVSIRSQDRKKRKDLIDFKPDDPHLSISNYAEYLNSLRLTKSSHFSFALSLIRYILQLEDQLRSLKEQLNFLDIENSARQATIRDLLEELN